jgi:hypothetical protein
MGNTKKPATENYIKDIRLKTRRTFTVEQKIMIVMEAFRAELTHRRIMPKVQYQRISILQMDRPAEAIKSFLKLAKSGSRGT